MSETFKDPLLLAPVWLVKPNGVRYPYGAGAASDAARGAALLAASAAAASGDVVECTGDALLAFADGLSGICSYVFAPGVRIYKSGSSATKPAPIFDDTSTAFDLHVRGGAFDFNVSEATENDWSGDVCIVLMLDSESVAVFDYDSSSTTITAEDITGATIVQSNGELHLRANGDIGTVRTSGGSAVIVAESGSLVCSGGSQSGYVANIVSMQCIGGTQNVASITASNLTCNSGTMTLQTTLWTTGATSVMASSGSPTGTVCISTERLEVSSGAFHFNGGTLYTIRANVISGRINTTATSLFLGGQKMSAAGDVFEFGGGYCRVFDLDITRTDTSGTYPNNRTIVSTTTASGTLEMHRVTSRVSSAAHTPFQIHTVSANKTYRLIDCRFFAGASGEAIDDDNASRTIEIGGSFTANRPIGNLITLAYSKPGKSAVNLTTPTGDLATGDGIASLPVPDEWHGHNAVKFRVTAIDAGTTNASTFMVRRSRAGTEVDMLNTALSLASAGYNATSVDLNTSNDDLQSGDILIFDCDSVSTTAPKGVAIEVYTALP